MRNKYPSAFRARCLKRLQEPNAMEVKDLAKETGVSQFTLYSWLRQAKEAPFVREAGKGKKGKRWAVEDQIRILAAANELSDAELGPYLRREGVRSETLEAWREALQGNRPDKSSQRRIKSLEKELQRKESALAEAAALLILQKKAQAIWGDGEDDTPEKTES